jgi:hypothetical protein
MRNEPPRSLWVAVTALRIESAIYPRGGPTPTRA